MSDNRAQATQQIPQRGKPALPQKVPATSMFSLTTGLIVLVVLIIGLFLYTVFFPAKSASITKRGPKEGGAYELLQKGNAGLEIFSTTDDKSMMIRSQDEAIQFFVYLDGNLRMGQAVDTDYRNNGPSQDHGLYKLCTCTSNDDCSNCVLPTTKTHTGYQTVVNIQDTFVLEVLNAPDASRPNSVAAQIYVKTKIKSPTDTFNIETFPLPPLPEQKWTMVTISKQGRQINVYFNSTLVLAKKAQNNFSTITPTCSPVRIGSNSLSGKVAMITYFSLHQTIHDVSARYQELTDTRGNLNTMSIVPTSTSYTVVDVQESSIIKTLCLDLSCFNIGPKGQTVPTIPPIYNSLETQYA